MIEIDSIDLFYAINSKNNNDSNNKIRECILYKILNKEIPNEWFDNEKWCKIKQCLFSILNLTDTNIYKIEHKGGRNYNYDFLLTYYNDSRIIKEIKIEFKYNCNRLDKYPQFLSISSNNFIKDEGYVSFFYDNYVNKLAQLLNIDIPEKNMYIKYIHNNDYDKLPFFRKLKDNESLIKIQKNKLVNESISIYLNSIVNLNIELINKTLQEKEYNKEYLLFKNGKFVKDKISDHELELTSSYSIKNNNTIILNTKSDTKIAMLLRWKNHKGILYPAWQISLINRQ